VTRIFGLYSTEQCFEGEPSSFDYILSLQFFEDAIISQCFCLTSFISQDIQSELIKMAVKIKSGLINEHRGGWALIILMDGKAH
jgi:hypothetical protein